MHYNIRHNCSERQASILSFQHSPFCKEINAVTEPLLNIDGRFHSPCTHLELPNITLGKVIQGYASANQGL